MFKFLGSRGLGILGLLIGLGGVVANAGDVVGHGAADVAQHVAGFAGLLLAALGGSVAKTSGS